jgi:hypothetical protein
MRLGNFSLTVRRHQSVRGAVMVVRENHGLVNGKVQEFGQKRVGRFVLRLTRWPNQRCWIAEAVWYR